jgi:hypothetical protein
LLALSLWNSNDGCQPQESQVKGEKELHGTKFPLATCRRFQESEYPVERLCVLLEEPHFSSTYRLYAEYYLLNSSNLVRSLLVFEGFHRSKCGSSSCCLYPFRYHVVMLCRAVPLYCSRSDICKLWML